MDEDKELVCIEINCETPGRKFVFTKGEQAFFAAKGFTPPKRCEPCRKRKTAQMKKQKDAAYDRTTG